MHRSVRQFVLEWQRRKAARQEGSATVGAAMLSATATQPRIAQHTPATIANATTDFASAAPSPPIVTRADASQAVAASEVEYCLTSKSDLPGLPQIPARLQVQPQHFLQPQLQSQSLHQLKNSVRQGERKQQQQQQQQQPQLQHRVRAPLEADQSEIGVGQTPMPAVRNNLRQAQTDAGPSHVAYNASPREGEPAHIALSPGVESIARSDNSDGADDASPNQGAQGRVEAASSLGNPTSKAVDDNTQHGGAGVDSLAQDVLQHIKIHHDGLRTILTEQMEQKYVALGLQRLESKLLSLEGRKQVKQDLIDCYNKTLELMFQNVLVDDRD